MELKSILTAMVTAGPVVLAKALEVGEFIAPMVPAGVPILHAAKLALTGSAAPSKRGKVSEKLAAERAVNTKAYLVDEKGVDASRISVYTGTAGSNTVTSELIPAGASTPSDLGTSVDEGSVKAQPRTAPARKHHKK